jgi:GNAT superfamily N-acetyltransferase
MSNPIVIRRASSADHERLIALHKASLSELASAYYDTAAIKAQIDHSGPLLGELIALDRHYVIEFDDLLVASGGWSARASAQAWLVSNIRCPPPHAVVRAVYVHPAWARRGFARCIMTEVEADMIANGHRQADLVATLNSIAFYKRLGYVGSTPIDLSLPHGASFHGLNMSKALAPSEMTIPTRSDAGDGRQGAGRDLAHGDYSRPRCSTVSDRGFPWKRISRA